MFVAPVNCADMRIESWQAGVRLRQVTGRLSGRAGRYSAMGLLRRMTQAEISAVRWPENQPSAYRMYDKIHGLRIRLIGAGRTLWAVPIRDSRPGHKGREASGIVAGDHWRCEW
jgi:hypothetical protein